MPDQDFEKLIKNTMDEVVNQVDGPTQHRLHQAREQAMQQGTKASRRPWWPAAIASTATAAAVVLTWTLLTPPQGVEADLFEDVDILAAESDPEFYAELEFISWLEENPSLVNDA